LVRLILSLPTRNQVQSLQDFQLSLQRAGIAESERELPTAAETNIARQQRQEEAFGLSKTEGGLQTSGKGESSKLCGNETARCAGNS